MSNGSGQVLTELRQQFVERIKGSPSFDFPEVSNISPGAVAKAITECSQCLEYTSDLLAEMPILRFKVSEIERLSRAGDVDPTELASTKDFILTHGKYLETRESKFKTHLSTLRSLLSAVTRHPNLMSQEIDEEK